MSQSSVAGKKIRKGDKVIVISGNYRGQSGVVMSRHGDKIMIQGINVRKKHIKRSQQNPKGNIIEIERPIHASNVKICVDGDKAVKLKIKEDKEGQRQLYYQDGAKDELYRLVKKPK